ncbi:hypothetical protein A6A25_06830 [Saccharothrix sp. CB00851]|nr:hypothetical protein A6A25_06830 [Saccharothrix sp. CB00851]
MTNLDAYRLLPAQRRTWSRTHDARSTTVTVRLAAAPDPARLRAAVDALTDRHEALRLRLEPRPGVRVPLQVVDPDLRVGSALGDPVTGPLVAVTAYDTELVVSASELVADAESVRLLLLELDAVHAGRPLPDDDDRLQFLDVSEWRLDQGETLPPVAARPFAVPLSNGGPGVRREVARVASADELFAAWALALGRYVDEQGLPVAWYSAGRAAAGTADVVGPLECAVPVVVDRGWTADDAVAALREAERTLPVAPPADDLTVGFSVTRAVEPAELAGLGAVAVTVRTPVPEHPLHLHAEIRADEVRLTLSFDGLSCDETTAAWLLDAVATRLDGGNALGEAELARLVAWAGTEPAPAPSTLTALLDAGIRNRDGEAVRAEDGVLTFAELDALATTIAARLHAREVGPGDRVAVLAERSWRTVAAFVGILRAGAVYVPLDPAAPRRRTAQLVEAVGPRLVLTTGPVPELSVPVEEIPAVPDPGASVDTSGIVPDQDAYVIFTSGSTGVPRPVVVEHRAAASLTLALADTVYGAEPGPLRVAVNAPFTFDASVKQLVQLAHGHTLHVLADDLRQDPRALLDHLAAARVDVLDCTPSHLRLLLSAGAPLPRLLLVGGEAVDQDLWDHLAALPGTRSVDVYGPTECTVDTTAAEITASRAPTIGRPLPGARVWVLDEHLRPVPVGVPGELCVSGDRLARGYLGDPVATAERFVTTTLPDGTVDRVYRTGDRVAFGPDGALSYLGRLDDQLKVNGIRVEPGEVAGTLAAHPGVRRAVVTGRDDDGHGTRLVAYVQPVAAAHLDLDRVDGVNPHETRYLYDEIFRQRAYLRGGVVLRDRAVVFDVGANIGMFSLFAHAECDTATVYAFEPLPAVHAKLTANLAAHDVPAHVFGFGLSDTEQDVAFTFYPGYSVMSGRADYADAGAEVELIKRYLTNERGTDSAELLARADEILADRFAGATEVCRLRRLSDVIDELGVPVIDLLKVDVQRAELDVLRGLDERHWPVVRQIAAEVHDGVGTETEGRVEDVVGLLEDRGFDVVVEQDAVLAGTDRFMLYAVRPEYAHDPRPVVGAGPVGAVAEDELRDWLAERLPAYLVPSAVVVLDEFPLTDRGKVDRAALPAPSADRGSGDHEPPADDVEEALVEIWQDVLGVAPVGVTDNFFQLGGDSIRTIRVQAAAARRGLAFPLQSMFTHQTIRDLARSGVTGTVAEPPGGRFTLLGEADRRLMPADVEDAYPITVLQQGMLYHSTLTGRAANYHNVTTYRVTAPLDPDALRSALTDTVAAHPILRTGFHLGRYSEPLQLVHRDVPVPLVVEDLRELDPVARRARIAAVVRDEVETPFDFAVPPLVRFRAFGVDRESFELLVSEYHAVLDGWSLALVLEEIANRYERLLHGEPEPPPTRSMMPFRRFVEVERAARTDSAGRAFWQGQLAGAAPLLIGAAGGQPPRTDRVLHQPLPADLPGRLERVGAEFAVPLKALLLAVHVRAVAEQTGRDDVITGLVTSTRTGEDGGDRTLGLFLNTLPLRLAVGEDPPGTLAQRAWRAEQQLMGHHLVPLADIERAAGRGRLFDAFFNFTRFDKPDPGRRRVRLEPGTTIPVDVGFALAVDFEVDPRDNGLRLSLTYAGEALRDGGIAELAARYTWLLDRLCAEPDVPLPAVATAAADVITEWEDRLTALWGEVLGHRPRSRDADFFEAGGDSLSALRLVSALRERHDVPVDLPSFTREPRFDALLARCAGG